MPRTWPMTEREKKAVEAFYASFLSVMERVPSPGLLFRLRSWLRGRKIKRLHAFAEVATESARTRLGVEVGLDADLERGCWVEQEAA